MQFVNFEPPSSPSLDQQRDALKKGLGRTMRWARSGVLEDGPLLEACLRDQRFDMQIEEPRGRWLWRLIRAAGAADRFRVPILHALYDLADDRSANQLCELGGCYAESGDDAFRLRLYDIVEQKPFADDLTLGEEEILRLDGESAFLFAARVRGEGLPGREWEWDDGFLVDEAIERLGEARVAELLNQSQDGAVVAFRSGWQAQNELQKSPEPRPTYQEEMRSISVGEILSAAESDTARLGYFRFRGWGKYASEADLEAVFRKIRSAREPVVIARLLRVFSDRAAPAFAPRFIELTRHADDDVQHWATMALEQIELPIVRDHALAELREGGRRAGFVVGILARNYRPGDEMRVLESLDALPDEDWERHSLLMDVIKLLEANPEADRSTLGLIAYACTPCEHCRRNSVRFLLEAGLAPEWLIEECRFDSSEKSREIAVGVAGPRESELE